MCRMSTICVLAFLVAADAVFAALPLDLRGWKQESYPNGLWSVDSPPNWSLANWSGSGDALSVTQTTNTYPALFYSDFPSEAEPQHSVMSLDEFSIGARVSRYSWDADDFIGFALGFQPGDSTNPSANYILVDWKGASQSYGGSFSPAGLAVSRVEGVPSNPFPEFWEHSGAITELQRASTLGDTGWEFGTEYVFDVSFTPTNLSISVNGTSEISLDGSFSDGHLGFYNYSQPGSTYYYGQGTGIHELPPPPGPARVVQSVVNQPNRHVYHLIKANDGVSGVSWTEAEDAAEELGGHLATVNDAAENAWITSTFSDYYPWIGLNDVASDGNFVWASGEAANYRNWWPGEPHDLAGGEDYVHIYNFAQGNQQWNTRRNIVRTLEWPMVGVAEVPELTGKYDPGPHGYDLPVIEEFFVGDNRASQGITSDGQRFYTSKTYLRDPVRSISRFKSNWVDDGQNLQAGDNGNWDGSVHIGGIAADDRDEYPYIYAAIDDSSGGEANANWLKIAYYNKDTLEYEGDWDISTLTYNHGVYGLGGVAYDDGKLYVVEYGWDKWPDVLRKPTRHIAVFDIDHLLGGLTFPQAVYEMTTDKANGIEINGDLLYVSWGMPPSQGRIDVFDMDDFMSWLDKREEDREPVEALLPLSYSTRPTWGGFRVEDWLHAEDLLYVNGELWVASFNSVARLDTAKFPTSVKRSTGSGLWFTAFQGGEPDEGTAAVIDGGSVQIAAAAVALDAIVKNGGALVLQDDGTMTLGDRLDVRHGTYVVEGGDLQVAKLLIGFGDGGAFEITDASSAITVSERIAFGPNGSISAVPGSTIHMTSSDLENSSTTPGDYADMINLSMIFEGGDQVIDFFEVAGEDMGATADGQLSNFALGTLELGGAGGIGQVMLVDLFDNQPGWEGVEAQYLENLIVNPDSTLYLNGMNLYAGGFMVHPGDGNLYGGGTISPIPEPSTMILLSMGALGLLVYALRKRRGR